MHLDSTRQFQNIIISPSSVSWAKGWLKENGYTIEFEKEITYPEGTLLNVHEGKINIGARKGVSASLRNVSLWIDGNVNDVDIFLDWLQKQFCSIANTDEKLGAVGVKTIGLNLTLYFKPHEEVKDV